MIGPQYERLAQFQYRYTAKQMLQKAQSKIQNPLHQIVDKLKRQYSQYDTAYSDDIINHKITSIDRLLSFDGKLGPILSSLEKQNNLLRRELAVMQNQLSNSVSICEHIITQNNQQKLIIQRKNQDIEKIIETIATNQSQALSDYSEKIQLLQQQNAILIRHLEEIKKQQEQYSNKFTQKDEEISKWKRKLQQTKKHLNEAIIREHDLSRKLSLSEQNLYQQTQENYKLQQNLYTLQFQNNQLQNQLLLHKNQQNQIKTPKKEGQFNQMLNQYKQLKKQRSQLVRQCQKLKIQNDKLSEQLNNFQKNFNKAIKDLQLTTSLLNDQKQKNASLAATISKLQSKIDDLKNNNSQLQMEKQSTNTYAINKEKLLQKQIEELRTYIDRNLKQSQRKANEIKDRAQSLVDAKQIELQRLNQANYELRRQLERQRNKS